MPKLETSRQVAVASLALAAVPFLVFVPLRLLRSSAPPPRAPEPVLEAPAVETSSAAEKASPALPRARDPLDRAIETLLDETAPIDSRVRETTLLASVANTEPYRARRADVALAFDALLATLPARGASEEHSRLALAALRALWSYDLVWAELPRRVRRFIAPGVDHRLRETAVGVIERRHLCGLAGDLIAILDEPYADEKPTKDHDRTRLEPQLARATRGLELDEATAVLEAILTKSKLPSSRRRAVRELGAMVVRRDPGELDVARIASILTPLAAEKGSNAEIGDLAAQALLRHGSWRGAPLALARLSGKFPQRFDYEVFCAAAHVEGFAGLAPRDFDVAPVESRSQAVAAVTSWFEGAKGRSVDDVTLDALAAAGVSVPEDRSSRAVVLAAIDGLSAPTIALRAAALDLLVRRTGATDFARRYETFEETAGTAANPVTIETEVDEQLLDSAEKREKLLRQQDEKARRLRAWWLSVAASAVRDAKGVWRIKT